MQTEWHYKDFPNYLVRKLLGGETYEVLADGRRIATIDVVFSQGRGWRYRPKVNGLVVSDTSSMDLALRSIEANVLVNSWMPNIKRD